MPLLTDFVILVLASLGIHRLWNHEDIFAESIAALRRMPALKALWCPACNAFWIALAVVGSWTLFPVSTRPILTALAIYPVIRCVMFFASYFRNLGFMEPQDPPKAAPPAATTTVSTSVLVAQPTGCAGCAKKKAGLQENHANAMTYDSRVVILTALASFPASYSVSTVVLDQARMLAENPRRLIEVWVMEGTDVRNVGFTRGNVRFLPIIPAVPWIEDVVNEAAAEKLTVFLRNALMNLGNATVITHDLLFISHYLTFAAAIHRVADTQAFAWLHVCHSAAGKERPSAEIAQYRASLPAGHRLLCLNIADRENLAAYYATTVDNVSVATNARDITTFGRFDPHAQFLVEKHDLSGADVVQVLPVSSTRLGAKGLPVIISIFGRLARRGRSVRLILANAHANGEKAQTALVAYRKQAIEAGIPADSFIVTSEAFEGSAADGLPATAIRDLLSVSNLFLLPSISEASSLVLLEAALSGCLIVTNASVPTMGSMVSTEEGALSFRFGSVRDPNDRTDHDEVATAIDVALRSSPANRAKRHVLKAFSYKAVLAQLEVALSETPAISPRDR